MLFVNKSAEDFLPTIQSASIDAVIMDPPYLYLDSKLDKPFDEELVFSEIKRILKPTGMLAMFGRGESFYRWGYIVTNLKLEFKEELIWDKKSPSSPLNALGRTHETVSIWAMPKGKINKVYIKRTEAIESAEDYYKYKNDLQRIVSAIKNLPAEEFDQWRDEPYYKKTARKEKHGITVKSDSGVSDRPNAAGDTYRMYRDDKELAKSVFRCSRDHYNFLHPTTKPGPLMELLVNLCSQEGDTVLDCFAGSGSTLQAAIKLRRRAIGCELDEEYYKIALDNLNGQKDLFSL